MDGLFAYKKCGETLIFFCQASEATWRRLHRLKECLEAAAMSGCYGLEVDLGTLGPAQWWSLFLFVPLFSFFLAVSHCQSWAARWWDGRNQDVVGDFLTELGLQCKFRKPPATDKSEYPSLYVSWYDEEKVLNLVKEKHGEKSVF